MKIMFFAVALIASASGSAAMATNLVANGGFETGDFSYWTFNNGSDHPWTVVSDAPTDGVYAASTGCVGPQCTGGQPIIPDASFRALDTTPIDLSAEAYLYQTIATIPGTSYSLSFDYTPTSGTPNELKVLFGDTLVSDILNIEGTSDLVTYTFAGLVASSNSTQLEFLARQDPGYNRLDNISLSASGDTSVSAAPEASTWIMMILGFGLIGGVMRSAYRKSEENFTRKVRSIATA